MTIESYPEGGHGMLRITKEADYALRICLYLSKTDAYIKAAEIAEKTGVTKAYTVRILRTLMLAGILDGKQGNGGGHRLARAAEVLSLGEIIEAIDGEIAVCDCLSCAEPCSQYGDKLYSCALHTYFSQLNADLRADLYRTMLSSVASGTSSAALF